MDIIICDDCQRDRELLNNLNWWKILLVLVAFGVLGFIYFKATVKQMLFYVPLCYGMVVLIEFLVLSVGGLFIDTINLFSEEHNYIFGTIAKLCEVLAALCVRRIWKSPNEFNTLKRKEWYMLICVPLFSIACIMGLLRFFNGEKEIVILLGNLLDNAIIECEKVVKAGKDAVIQFKLVYEDGKLILSIKNPVHAKVRIVDNKVQVNPRNGHGIGLKNVEAVAEKYDGSIAFECDEKEFRAVAIL